MNFRLPTAGLIALGLWASALAADLRITGIVREADGSVRITHGANNASYYLLLRGSQLGTIATPRDAALGTAGAGQLQEVAGPAGTGFFRVQEVSLDTPLDSDGDGIDDVFELQNPGELNALDPADADRQAPGAGGQTWRQVYAQSHGALTLISETSPASNESGVAVTRETVLRFSRPLAVTTSLGLGQLRASFGGRTILSRVELSTDRTKATLFFLENLPASARIRITFDAAGVKDVDGREVDADGDDKAGGVANLDFDTLGITPVGETVVVGHVFDSAPVPDGAGGFTNRPLANVTVSVDGNEQTLRTTTDENGYFKLQPAPAGRFFVHVDGRTSPDSDWPDGAYYPFVGKAWEAVAGRTNLANATGLIYLPRVPSGALQPVSATQDTTITFIPELVAANPALAGVEVRVPANALFDDNGVRGGRVGIAPVPPDRLPEPLPPGLNFPLVITIQTDGARNFDRPVPVRFPNLPDPTSGKRLQPGQKSALWSFDHDKGYWEVVGPMTVTADGLYVETDAGVGVLQPGWHGSRRGTRGGSPPPDGCGGGDFNFESCRNGVLAPAADYAKNAAQVLSNPGGAGLGDARTLLEGLDGMTSAAAARNQYCLACCTASFGSEVCGALGGGPDDLPRPFGGSRGRLAQTSTSEDSEEVARLSEVLKKMRAHLALLNQQATILGAAARPEDLPADKRADYERVAGQIVTLFAPLSQAQYYQGAVGIAQSASSYAARNIPSTPLSGTANYLLEDLTSGLIRRGTTGVGGALNGLIFSPDQLYRLQLYFPNEHSYGGVTFVSGPNASEFSIPKVILINAPPADSDADGLADVAEAVLGTNPSSKDTDGDGVIDGAEVANGTNPLDNVPAEIGLIGAVALNGALAGTATAFDVCAQDDRAYVALDVAGVAVLDVGIRANPRVIAQVNTPGTARRVACDRDRLAVADGPTGLAIVDITDPPAAFVSSQVPVGNAISVVTADGLAYVGTAEGDIVWVHLATGTELGRINVGAPVHDLAWQGAILFAQTASSLNSLQLEEDGMTLLGTLPVAGRAEGITDRRRLSVGNGVAYVTSYPGYSTINVSNPAAMSLIAPAVDAGPNSFKQIVPTGSGLGVAAVGVNPRDDGTHDVELYDVKDPAITTAFLARIPTPGLTYAIALHRGAAYVADGTAGFEVLNFLAADTGTKPPTVKLGASFALSPAQAEGGSFAALLAEASDDVLVREVGFYLDGALVETDGNYPFEHRFRVPKLTAEKTTFTIQARSIDTGGNAAATPVIPVQILPDITAPKAKPAQPIASGFGANVTQVTAIFSEPILADTLKATSFTLAGAGLDRAFGTADDVTVTGEVSLVPESRTGVFNLASPLTAGRYQARLTRAITDLTGNALAAEVLWNFEAVTGLDTDGDGLTDEFELASGLDPQKADQNGNGIPDAVEDFDGDGLGNGVEMLIGTNAKNARTFENVPDAQLDRDGDYLRDAVELGYGTDRLNPDTDGDGWNDEIEITTGSNPLIRNAYLLGVFVSRNLAHVLALDGPQFSSAQGDVLRLGDGQVMQSTSTANVLLQGGPNENGYTVNQALPPVRIRQFDLEATDLSPNELPTAGAFVIEAEDYNYGSGQRIPAADLMPYLGGAYAGLAATLGVDYFNTDGNDSDLYRPDTAPNNVNLVPNLAGRYGIERPAWNSTNSLRIGWTASGDWQQYTRTIPSGQYWIWGALSHSGRSAGQLSASLDLVTGDTTLPNPALTQLGTFNGSGTGAFGDNSLVLLRDGTTAPYVLNVTASATTFRLNLNSGDFDWFVLIPTNSAPQ